MTPADDKPEFAPSEPGSGLEAYVAELHGRHGVPARLRYPETREDYARMVAEARASGYVPAEEVEAWLRSLGTDTPSPRPRPR